MWENGSGGGALSEFSSCPLNGKEEYYRTVGTDSSLQWADGRKCRKSGNAWILGDGCTMSSKYFEPNE
jgi:hypothetical protein